MRVQRVQSMVSAVVVSLTLAASLQAQSQGPVKVTLEEAIQMAIAHNHSLKAARTTIQQSEAMEMTANLRPNPVLLGDAQFLPIFQPSQFSSSYLDNSAQFDLGLSYLFERGGKRQHRLQAAKDVTAETRSLVADNERSLAFNVASQFVSVQLAESTLDLAREDLKSFQNTVDINEYAYKRGIASLLDFLDAERSYRATQLSYRQSLASYLVALEQLRQAVGTRSLP